MKSNFVFYFLNCFPDFTILSVWDCLAMCLWRLSDVPISRVGLMAINNILRPAHTNVTAAFRVTCDNFSSQLFISTFLQVTRRQGRILISICISSGQITLLTTPPREHLDPGIWVQCSAWCQLGVGHHYCLISDGKLIEALANAHNNDTEGCWPHTSLLLEPS